MEGERRLEAENVKFPLNNNDFDVGGSCLLVDLPGCVIVSIVVYVGSVQLLSVDTQFGSFIGLQIISN